MSPEEIIEAYNVVADDLNNYTAQEAAKIGNSQASLGLMAERVARPSGQTYGLANYTYDRTLRPTVDSLTASLITTGKAQGLENELSSQLRAAKNRYEDAKNAYTVAATTPSNNGGGGDDTYTEETDTEFSGEQIDYPKEGTVIGTGSSGDGVYDVIVADGKGGFTRHQYFANSGEEARNKYYAQYGRPGMKEGASSSASSGSEGKGTSGGGGGGGGGGGR